jgi:multicomponent Na+:H+ antiporter subunit G
MIYAGYIMMALGFVFFVGTVLGVHRFPDCYTRMHGAAKGDTLSSILFILGIILVAFHNDNHHFEISTFVRTAKLLFIIAFLFIASPAAAHALVAAGFSRGLAPWQNSVGSSDGGEQSTGRRQSDLDS